MQAVVSAFEFQNLVAAGGGARQADSVHGGFGAAAAEANHLDRKTIADFLGQFPFHVVRHAEHGSSLQTRLDGLHHRGMAVSGHQRAEAEIVIDVVIAIEIAEMGAAAFLYENGVRIVSAIVAGHA